MSIISKLATQMITTQNFSFESFSKAVAAVKHPYRKKTLEITYDRLSLFIYSHNLTARQYHELGKKLSSWETSHNSEDQKKRIEYGILFQYALLHPEYQQAHILKSIRPDFVVELNGKTIGIEITRLEKESDNIMSKIISIHNKPGMKANEILAIAFNKHGEKTKEYEILELEEDVFAIHHIESMLISDDEFIDQIDRKIEKYKAMVPSYDKFILLCSAQKGITVTSESNAVNLINSVLEKNPGVMNIAVLYLSAQNILHCTEYDSD